MWHDHPPDKNAATHGANQRAADNKKQQKDNATNTSRTQGRFDPARLPNPADVLRRLDIPNSGKVNSAGYLIITCPFHKNGQEQNPSLNLHAVGGYYRCHSCGAHGGDVLALYMAATGKSFRDAAHDLGAWRTGV